MTVEEKEKILAMSYQKKKELLIKWIKNIGELGEGIERNDMTEETIEQIFDVLFTEDETERQKKINGYVEEERKIAERNHKDLMQIISRIEKFGLKVKELRSSVSDEKDISDLENKIFNI